MLYILTSGAPARISAADVALSIIRTTRLSARNPTGVYMRLLFWA
jgi:hypothetical protein